MINTILGTKNNMSTVFNQQGRQVPVTTVVAEPNIIVGQKTGKLVLGLGKKKRSKKTEGAFVLAAGFTPRFIKEVKMATKSSPTPEPPQETQNQTEQTKSKLGEKVSVAIFGAGDEVKITGTTKGKGFAGSVKRWNFAGGPKTHGQSDRHRAPGSIGAGTTPGRVYKGKKMAGHLGNSRLTVTGLEVIEVDVEKNVILIKGAVPGPKNGFLIIEKTGKVKSYTPPPPPSEEKQAEKEARAEESEGTKGTEGTEVKEEAKAEQSAKTEVKDENKSTPQEDKQEGQNAEK